MGSGDEIMTFSIRLKQLRKEYKITQPQLAQAVNITDRTLRNYESGTMEPNLSVLTALADYFQCSVDYITGRSDSRE